MITITVIGVKTSTLSTITITIGSDKTVFYQELAALAPGVTRGEMYCKLFIFCTIFTHIINDTQYISVCMVSMI